jgi:hypothetical protein
MPFEGESLMARRPKIEMEDRWYDVFSGWTQADREAALKVLATLHRHLPDTTKDKPAEEKPE